MSDERSVRLLRAQKPATQTIPVAEKSQQQSQGTRWYRTRKVNGKSTSTVVQQPQSPTENSTKPVPAAPAKPKPTAAAKPVTTAAPNSQPVQKQQLRIIRPSEKLVQPQQQSQMVSGKSTSTVVQQPQSPTENSTKPVPAAPAKPQPPKKPEEILSEKLSKGKKLSEKPETELKGNEAYLMIGDKFIKPNKLTSGLESEDSSNTKPIDPEYAKCIQDFVKKELKIEEDVEGLELTFGNSAHSEQRMLYYIYKNYIENKPEPIPPKEKIDITIFTGRKCCETCSAVIKEFAKKYEKYVNIMVIDFWLKKQDKDKYYNTNTNNLKFTNALDNDLTDKDKAISAFNEKIKSDRKKYTMGKERDEYQIANEKYTIESLKGDSNNPILIKIEELIDIKKLIKKKKVNLRKRKQGLEI